MSFGNALVISGLFFDILGVSLITVTELFPVTSKMIAHRIFDILNKYDLSNKNPLIAERAITTLLAADVFEDKDQVLENPTISEEDEEYDFVIDCLEGITVHEEISATEIGVRVGELSGMRMVYVKLADQESGSEQPTRTNICTTDRYFEFINNRVFKSYTKYGFLLLLVGLIIQLAGQLWQ